MRTTTKTMEQSTGRRMTMERRSRSSRKKIRSLRIVSRKKIRVLVAQERVLDDLFVK